MNSAVNSDDQRSATPRWSSRIRFKLLLLATTCVGICAGFSWHFVHSTPYPRAEAPKIVDLGPQKLGQQAIAKFTVTNRGSASLQLFDLQTSCGCLEIARANGERVLKTENIVVQPGSSVKLRATLSIRGMLGDRISDSITFWTNDPTSPRLRIDLVAELEAVPVVAIPNEVVIAEIATDQTEKRKIILRVGHGHKDFQIARIINPIPEIIKSISATPITNEPRTLQESPRGKDSHELVLDIRAPATPGVISAAIQVLGDNDTEIVIPISLTVVKSIHFVPSTLYLPRGSEQGEIFAATCMCRSPKHSKLEIAASRLPVGFSIQVRKSPNASNHVLFDISIDAIKMPNAGRYLLSLQIRHSGGLVDVDYPVVIENPVPSNLE